MTFRIFASVPLQRPALGVSCDPNGNGQPIDERGVFSAEAGWVTAQIYDREALPAGTTLHGPAVVHQRDTTTFVPAGVEASVDDEGNLVLSLMGPPSAVAALESSDVSRPASS